MAEQNITSNKSAVSLADLGENAHLRISIEALEIIQKDMMLETDFDRDGEGMAVFFGWMDRLDYQRIKQTVDLALINADAAALFDAYTISEIAEKLSNAMSLTLHGRTAAEQVALREREYLAQISRLKGSQTDEQSA